MAVPYALGQTLSGILLPVNNIVDEMPWVGLSGPRLRTGTTNNEQRRCYCRGHWFGGLRAPHSLREIGLAVTVLEASDGLGGVWHCNRNPGARCDVESYDYSYMFLPELEQDWRWSERYATQPEVLRYTHHFAEQFDLRRDIEFNTRMSQAVFDEHGQRWTVRSADGREWSAQIEGVHAFFWRRAWLPTHSRKSRSGWIFRFHHDER